jgi:hypothetical protein
VAEAWVVVAFDALADESDEHVARLTRELGLDLRDVGVVEPVRAAADDGTKGGDGAVVATALAVLTAADPTYVQALVDTLRAFLNRHQGRAARLKVGEIELAIDKPSTDEVAQLIEITRSAIEARAAEPAGH